MMLMHDIIRQSGGVTKLAKAVGRHHASVLAWDKIPVEFLGAVSDLTGIAARDLRPDLWEILQKDGRPTGAGAAA